MEQENLRCLQCGYALQGLPAHKCGECGHVYLRCPECGVSQVANEVQDRVLLRMRARAVWLPKMVQAGQMGLMAAVGVLLVALGFALGADGRVDGEEDALVLALLGGVMAALVRLLVLHLRRPGGVASWVGAAAFVALAFLVGLVFATAVVPGRPVLIAAMALPVVIGAVLGAIAAPAMGWLILRVYVKEGDRGMLIEAYAGKLAATLAEGKIPSARHLMYCQHCAAELPAMVPQTCGECGLLWVPCPACGKRCGVSGSLMAMLRFGEAMRVVRAGVLVCARLLATVAAWIALAGLSVEAIHGYGRAVGPIWGIFWVPTDLLTMSIILGLVAVVRWFVVVGRTGPATVWIAAMVFSASWMAVASYQTNGIWVRQASEVGAALFLTMLAVTTSLLASLAAVLVQAALPKRRVAMLEEVAPELAPAPTPTSARVRVRARSGDQA